MIPVGDRNKPCDCLIELGKGKFNTVLIVNNYPGGGNKLKDSIPDLIRLFGKKFRDND